MKKKSKYAIDGKSPSVFRLMYGSYDPDVGALNYSAEERRKIWELCRPKLTPLRGTVIIFGTGGENE